VRQSIKCVFRGLIFLLVVGISVELLVESYMFVDSKRKQEEPKPFYRWSFYTSQGQRLGNQRGMLKFMYHPQLAYVNFPNQRTKYFSINSEGFRGPEVEAKKVGERRIVVVGGSSAFGAGLMSDAETFEAKLGEKNKNVEVINAAVVGYKSAQELVFLVTKGMDLHPDLILAFDGSNDCWELDKEWPDVNGAYMIQDNLNYLDGFIYSNFFMRCVNIYRSILAKTIYYFHSREISDEKDSDNVGSLYAATYCANILKMDRLAKSYHANFICFLQPVKRLMYGREARVRERYLFSRAKEVFDRNNIKYVDLNLYKGLIKKEYFMDDVHLDARGNQIIADIIDRRLHKGDLL